MDRLATDSVKRIWYASFGNGPEEWFVDYEDKDGQRFYRKSSLLLPRAAPKWHSLI
jgi:hypothetical protein